MIHPTLDPNVACYRAAIVELDPMNVWTLNGGFADFDSAAKEARKVRDALLAAGRTGVAAHVTSSGKRPAGFPRNGVKV